MPLFLVRAPINGWVEIFVEAEDEEAAIAVAATDLSIECITEWEEDLSRAEVTDETPDAA